MRYLIHVGDIHIKQNKLHSEYKEILTNFINDVKTISKEKKGEIAILIAGDLCDNFCNVTNELNILLSWFLKELDTICPVLILAGNHDLTRSNLTKLDTLTPLFKMIDFQQTTFLDMVTEKKSGVIELDDNILLALYSIFDNYKRPNIEKAREEHPTKKVIGLVHAPIIGSKTDIGFTMDKGIRSDIFNGCDIVLMGDIHKRQMFNNNGGIPMYYCGSLIQQTSGETTNNHGFSVIDLETLEIVHHEVENPYKIYKFKISSIDDFENNSEIWKNKGNI
jgi:DNA repair exonuclease SbcCD nuclease subunit